MRNAKSSQAMKTIALLTIITGTLWLASACIGPSDFQRWCSKKDGKYEHPATGLHICVFKARNPVINAVWDDKNGDNKVQPRGEDKRPRTPDDEIRCHQGDSPTNPWIPCPSDLLTRAYVRTTCEEVGGAWTESGDTSYCRAPEWNFVFIWDDANQNDGLEIDEYRCETKDENGNPSGTEVPCPFDES
jgi:hypothetical protein